MALAGLLTSEASAAVPETLLSSILAAVKTAVATTATATGLASVALGAKEASTSTAAMLAKGAMKIMFWNSVKTAAMVAVIVGVVGVGGVTTYQAMAERPGKDGVATRAVQPDQGKAAVQTVDKPAVTQARRGVYMWGLNEHGPFGDGTTNSSSTGALVSGLSNMFVFAAGKGHTLAIKSDGTLWSWGLNDRGQLGDGTTTGRATPRQVPGLAGATFIGAGGDYTVALTHDKDKTVWAWGGNSHGQLGDGTTKDRLAPVEVKMQDCTPLTNVVTIAVGESHTVARQRDGTLWSWGLNDCGQLGDGTTVSRLTPGGVIQFAMGEGHTVALKTDGTLWSWGRNDSGQLGDGTLVNRLRPVQVTMKDGTSLSNVTMLCAGYGHTTVLRFGSVVPSNHVQGLAFADLSSEAGQLVPDGNCSGSLPQREAT